MKSDIGRRKIAEAKAHLAAAQKEQNAQEKASDKSEQRDQKTTLKIAGGYRRPLLHQTAFQKDLQGSPDYLVPTKLHKVKPAVCTK